MALSECLVIQIQACPFGLGGGLSIVLSPDARMDRKPMACLSFEVVWRKDRKGLQDCAQRARVGTMEPHDGGFFLFS